MALTVSASSHAGGRFAVGDRIAVQVAVTFDASYTTGGKAIDFRQFGIEGNPAIVLVAPRPASATTAFIVQYDRVNRKLQVFQQSAATSALTEVPNATDLHLLVCDVLAVNGSGV